MNPAPAATNIAPTNVDDYVERVLRGGTLGERIDRGFLRNIPLHGILLGLAVLLAAFLVYRMIRRIHLRMERRRDPYALPDRALARLMDRLRDEIRRLGDAGSIDPSEEGRWKKLLREATHAASRYERLVETFVARIEERDMQFIGNLQTAFDEMVAAWKEMRRALADLPAQLDDTAHLVNIRRRANDSVQDFLDAAKEFESRCSEILGG